MLIVVSWWIYCQESAEIAGREIYLNDEEGLVGNVNNLYKDGQGNKMEKYIELLDDGKTQYQVSKIIQDRLVQSGFEHLDMYDEWSLSEGGKYYVTPFSSVLFAFVVGNKPVSYRITSCHIDFPMLKLKSNPELLKKGYMEANVESYGGLIKETWFDRPLGIAGKVVVAGEDIFCPKVMLYDSKKPVCVIPSLAPHLKKDMKTDTIDVQKEMIPVFDLQPSGEAGNKRWLTDYISEKLGVNREDILDYDLYLYNDDKACRVGIKDAFLASPRIDNLSSAAAMLDVFCTDADINCVAVSAFFDNEEIGSRSKQGADSNLFSIFVDKITKELGKSGICTNGAGLMRNAFGISLDVAHALHPNYQEKSDITNDVVLGGGIVLKSSAGQRYVTDSEAGAVIEQLCRKYNIRLQRQVNRSGMPGGQTLGPIMSSYLPVKSVDMGIPVLAMHSASELAAVEDYKELVKLIGAFYKE